MREVKILREGQTRDYKYKLKLPEYLATWDVWDYWERERFASMESELTDQDTLFDIGTEHGWVGAIYSKFVGNICLFEPVPEMWGSIRAIWEANKLKAPVATCCVLVGNETRNLPVLTKGWCKESKRQVMTDKCGYKYIHEHRDAPQTTIDNFVAITKIIPTAITIDIEGAELLALQGAENTLREHKPIVWVSIHPDLAQKEYGVSTEQIHDFMQKLGYTRRFLAEDHEQHWIYKPKGEK